MLRACIRPMPRPKERVAGIAHFSTRPALLWGGFPTDSCQGRGTLLILETPPDAIARFRALAHQTLQRKTDVQSALASPLCPPRARLDCAGMRWRSHRDTRELGRREAKQRVGL